MNPGFMGSPALDDGKPRGRGDEPELDLQFLTQYEETPQTRG